MSNLYSGDKPIGAVVVSYDTTDTPESGSKKALTSGGAFDALSAKADLVDGKVPENQLPNMEVDAYTKAETLSDTTKTGFGLDTSAIPDDILAKLQQAMLYDDGNIKDVLSNTITLPGVKIATGSYTGTGTYGSANPCSLTFDFVPLIFGIYRDRHGNPANDNWDVLVVNGSNYMRIDTYYSGSNNYAHNKMTWDNQTVKWYVEASSDYSSSWQFNADGGTIYRYFAIGR